MTNAVEIARSESIAANAALHNAGVIYLGESEWNSERRASHLADIEEQARVFGERRLTSRARTLLTVWRRAQLAEANYERAIESMTRAV